MFIYDFFHSLAAGILNLIGFSSLISAPVATLMAIFLFLMTAIKLMQIAAKLYATTCSTIILVSKSHSKLKSYFNSQKQTNHDVSALMLGANLYVGLKRLNGKELDSLKGKSLEEVTAMLDEKFSPTEGESSDWKTAKIEKILEELK